jgi:hypothetical protein
MGDYPDARDHASTRLRDEADDLLEQTKRESDPKIIREMAQRADLLEHTAEMLDMAAQSPAGAGLCK